MGSVLIMGEAEYTKLCADEPDLKLPVWLMLDPSFVQRISRMTPEQLSAARRVAQVRRGLIGEKVCDTYAFSDQTFRDVVIYPETSQ